MNLRNWLVATTVVLATASAGGQSREAAVSRIDHLLVEYKNPEAVFELLSEKLQLPVVWPIASYGSFSSGGLYFGNVVIEVGRFGFASEDPQSALVGIALQPSRSASASVFQLDERRIAHDWPAPFLSYVEGRPQALWTNVRIRDIAPPETELFICEYHIDTGARLVTAAQALAGVRGGPLGLVRVKEVVVESSDQASAIKQWQSLLAPVSEREGVFAIANGPSIRVVAGARDTLRSLTIEVTSLRQATKFLAENSLIDDDRDSKFVLGKLGGPGLILQLVEH